MNPPVLEIAGLVRGYQGLRPLRIQSLAIAAGEAVALVGLDGPAAEALVNLVTGAWLPETGEVRIFGQPTGAITDTDAWLKVVDRFGLVSPRAVLLDPLSVVQNLAMPFSLDIEPPSTDLRERATALAAEVGLTPDLWDRHVGALDADARLRVRLGRALALEPAVLILEHPGEGLDRNSLHAVGRHVRLVAEARRAATLTLTADADFAAHVASRVLRFEPATGRLAAPRRRFWGH